MPARAFTALGGLVLLGSLFAPWYAWTFTIVTRGARNTETTENLGTLSAWEAFSGTDVLLATLAIAIVLLAARRLAGPATVLAALAPPSSRSGSSGARTTISASQYGLWIAFAAALAALVAARGIGART